MPSVCMLLPSLNMLIYADFMLISDYMILQFISIHKCLAVIFGTAETFLLNSYMYSLPNFHTCVDHLSWIHFANNIAYITEC